ncbi:MAG: dienelactone hydrolase family protein [Chloroflexota bacterium]
MSPTYPEGFLALPSTGKGSIVLVLHASWGLNDTIKTVCKRLAEAGFVAFAADLYHGKVTDKIDEATTLGAAVDANVNQARAELVDATMFLRERAGSDNPGIAVVAFSLGAYYALDLSVNVPEAIRSVVLFYGTAGTVPLDFNRSRADYLGHFAEIDQFESQSNVSDLEEALKRAGRPVSFYQYSGIGHWFFEPDRADAYNPAAANLAWDRTLAFLKRSSTA